MAMHAAIVSKVPNEDLVAVARYLAALEPVASDH
jgi:hypothetical protein